MGDRTTVEVHLRREDSVAFSTIVPDADDGPEPVLGQEELVLYRFYGVNYGELPNHEQLFCSGIPLDYFYAAGEGGSYESGMHFVRFTAEGERVLLHVQDSNVNPDLEKLLTLLATDTPETLGAVRAFIEGHAAKVKPMPWDNQGEYAKIYRTRKLIEPS